LSTVPPFTEVDFDAKVQIVPIGEAPELDQGRRREETGKLDLETVEPVDLGPQIVELPYVPEEGVDDADHGDETADTDDSASLVPMMLTVGRIPSARHPVRTVRESDLLIDAVDMMLTYDFDQLPVVDDGGYPTGMITWREIGATLHEPTALISDVYAHSVRLMHTTDPLIECLDPVATYGSVV